MAYLLMLSDCVCDDGIVCCGQSRFYGGLEDRYGLKLNFNHLVGLHGRYHDIFKTSVMILSANLVLYIQ